MKKTIILIALAMTACATPTPPATPAQAQQNLQAMAIQAQAVTCPLFKGVGAVVATDPQISATVRNDVAVATPIVVAFCSAKMPTALNWSDLASKGFPLAIAAMQADKASPSMIDSVIAAQTAFSIVMAQYQLAQPPAAPVK